MPVAYETIGASGTSSSSFTVAAPSGIASGDLLLAFLTEDTQTNRLSTHTGWTLASGTGLTSGHIEATGDMVTAVLYKIAGAGDVGATTYSFVATSTWTGTSCIVRISGADTTTPIDVLSAKDSASGTAHTSNSITPSDANCLLVLHAAHDPSAGQGWANSEGMTERMDQADGVAFLTAALYTQASSGTSALTRTANIRNAADTGAGTADVATIIIVAVKPAGGGGGTTYNQSAAGSLTSSGTAAKLTGKGLAGNVTSAGVALKQLARGLAGTLTSSGTLAAVRTRLIALTGSLTPGGTLARMPGKALSGAVTSAGTLARETRHVVTGTLTTSGTAIKQTARSLAGSLSSSGLLGAVKNGGAQTFQQAVSGGLALAGAVSRRTDRGLAGALALAGTVTKQTRRALAGGLTSSGLLAAVRTRLQAVGGTLASAGSLSKRTGKAASGALGASGGLTRRVALALSGAVAFAGTAAKHTARTLAGVLTSAGALLAEKLLPPSSAWAVDLEDRNGARTLRDRARVLTVRARAAIVNLREGNR